MNYKKKNLRKQFTIESENKIISNNFNKGIERPVL